jgi:acetylornithine deacetylase
MSATIEILRTLVAFQTVSRNSNLDLIEWVRDYLEGLGVRSRLSFDEDRSKANLFATIGQGEGGVVLSGHTDVVPVDGQNWTQDPFTLTERDGRLFGRGTSDMKGFIATVLAKVPKMIAARRVEPVHLAFSFDEEVGCGGAPVMLSDLIKAGIRPRGCIVGEPTSMKVVIGHKTGSAYIGTVTGLEIHSSLSPQGVNAVENAAELVVKIKEIADRLEREEQRQDGYEIPFSTLQTGVIEGGYASNIVPARCTFRFDVRTLPWTDPDTLVREIEAFAEEELLPAMRRRHPEAVVRIDLMGRVPGFAIEVDAPLTKYGQRLVGSNEPPGFVAFGSEAGIFQQHHIPAIICGPGSISQAHKPDEYVDLDQLAICEDFLDRLIEVPFH